MTVEIALVLFILMGAAVLFVTEWLRVDVVALLVLGSLALTGLVTPAEALAGFSSPAVVTVWAVFILSGGLAQTGVANVIGKQVLRLAGEGEVRLLLVIMLTAGILSAFMNNVGVAALLLPVVVDIARRTRRPPSRLLMPLAFGALLGGLTTLIGTPPNILVSDALRAAGLEPFSLFDYAPVGVVVMLSGVAFMVLVGRRLLPAHGAVPAPEAGSVDLEQLYKLQERMFVLRVPAGSPLAGKTLRETRFGSILGLTIIEIVRNGETTLSPGPNDRLHQGDRLLVVGRRDRLQELHQNRLLTVEPALHGVDEIDGDGMRMEEFTLVSDSRLAGQTLAEVDFRGRYDVNVLAIRRDGTLRQEHLQLLVLQAGDGLLVQGPREQVEALGAAPDFVGTTLPAGDEARLRARLLLVRVPAGSALAGKTLVESRLGAAFDLTVLRILRGGTHLLPEPEDRLQAGDTLLVQGEADEIATIRGLEQLVVDQSPRALDVLESAQVGLAEAVLSPHTTQVGKTLQEIHFREKYGLNVLAIWRAGRAYRYELRDMPLRFGDALLLYGPWENLRVLADEPDFVVLDADAQTPPRLEKAPVALLVLAAVLTPVIIGWLPIAIAAVVGATLMVLTRCLTMEDAYRFIEWPAVFLIAGMLPLGTAMETSGAARFLAEQMVALIGGFGPLAVLAGMFLLTTLASQVMPNPAVAVLMAPLALSTAGDLNASPYTFMMGIALAASASFLSPVSHPANVLIMGPGGYRISDYVKVGLPLTLVVFVVTMLVLPLVWPF